jgi:hypothetical protein
MIYYYFYNRMIWALIVHTVLNPRGHGVSDSALSSLKQGQGFDPFLCMENLFWGALYPSLGRLGASVN